MNKLIEFLKGKKTYIIALAAAGIAFAQPSRRVLRTDATSALVRVLYPDGTGSNVVVRLALMPGAVRIEADQTAQRAEQAAITSIA